MSAYGHVLLTARGRPLSVTDAAGAPGSDAGVHGSVGSAPLAAELVVRDERSVLSRRDGARLASREARARPPRGGAPSPRLPIQTRAIFGGRDDREPVDDPQAYPWRTIQRLRIVAASGVEQSATGWLASPRLVVTAGHCVFDHDTGGWARSIAVLPPGVESPEKLSANFRTVSGWKDGRNEGVDYGAILLDEPIGNSLGFFGYGSRSDEQLLAATLNIAGYPVGKPVGSLWWHARRVDRLTPTQLFYTIDTSGGQSGAPVWLVDGASRVAIGIHGNARADANVAVRINSAVFDNITRWAREADQHHS